MEQLSLWTVFGSEFVGTAILLLLGVGVVANVTLSRTLGEGGGFLMVTFGWGFAVLAGVYAAASSGGHINPAVTLGLLVSGADEYAPGVPVSAAATAVYVLAQVLGAFVGAVLAWAAYRRHFETRGTEAEDILGVFTTGPAIRSPLDNVVSEVIGTFVLVYIVLRLGDSPVELGPLPVALLVVGIGASLGGPTGYAINPARDLGPRIAHAVLPISRKGSSDWRYAWVPVVAPLIGAVLAGLLSYVSV